MKTIITLLVLLPVVLFAQDIPKKTSKIIIHNNLNAEDNFKLVGRTVLQNDYQIEKKDKDFGTIQTERQSYSKPFRLSYSWYFDFVISDNKIVLTGKMTSDELDVNSNTFASSDNWEKIQKRGMKKSLYWNTFQKMKEFSELFESKKIEYK